MAVVSQLRWIVGAVAVIACDTQPRPNTSARTDASRAPAPVETLITRIPRVARHASAMQRVTGRVTPRRAFEPLDSPLVIRVLDQRGAELRGVDVRWTLVDPADGAQLQVLNAKTDSLGLSRVTFTPGPSASGQGPVAEVANVGRIDFGIAVPVASIRIIAEPVLWSGDQQVAGVLLRDSAGVELHGGALSWGTSDTSVLRVQSADSLHAKVTGLLAGSAILYAWVGQGKPRGGAQLNVIPVLAGRFVTIDGSSPPPMRLEIRVGPRRDSVRVEQDAFTKRVEVLADADVELAATPATFAGAELYHSIRLRRVSQRQVQDLRITLVPRSWRIDAGTYQGQTLPIDAEVAMRRVSEGAPFWRLAPVSGLGPRTILGWRESDLPLHVAFDRRRSSEVISALDSVAFWDIAARMERDLGLSLFTPADMRDDTSRANFVRIEISSQIADGHTFVSWSPAGDVSDGVVQFRHTATMRDPHVATHELLHLIGFGHTNAWTTIAQPVGGHEQSLTPQDVAYVQLAMRLRRLQRQTTAVPGLPVAIQ